MYKAQNRGGSELINKDLLWKDKVGSETHEVAACAYHYVFVGSLNFCEMVTDPSDFISGTKVL